MPLQPLILYIVYRRIKPLRLGNSETIPYREFEWLSDAQLLEAGTALESDDWLVTKRFLNSQRRYMLEHRRVQLADANGQAVKSILKDIKPFTAYIFKVDLEYSDAMHDIIRATTTIRSRLW